jgi:hypothetical protein
MPGQAGIHLIRHASESWHPRLFVTKARTSFCEQKEAKKL